MIKAFLTNLGRYNEGELIGEWIDFPTTRSEFAAALRRIGIDGVRYEEWFISDYDIEIDGIYDILGEHENVDALNYFAAKLDDLGSWDVKTFAAAIEAGEHCDDIGDLIELCNGLGNYTLIEGIDDDYDLGYYYVEEAGIYDLKPMGTLAQYIDYERFGRDVRLEEGGYFAGAGYIATIDSHFEAFDVNDIPDEYRIIAKTKGEATYV